MLSAPAKPAASATTPSTPATSEKSVMFKDYIQMGFRTTEKDGAEKTTLTGYVHLTPVGKKEDKGEFLNFIVAMEKPNKDGSYSVRANIAPRDAPAKWVTLGALTEKNPNANEGGAYVELRMDLAPAGIKYAMTLTGFRGDVTVGKKDAQEVVPGIRFVRGEYEKFEGKTFEEALAEKAEAKAAYLAARASSHANGPSRG